MKEKPFHQVVEYYRERDRIAALPWYKRWIATWRFNRRHW